jgi:hypothetical protein
MSEIILAISAPSLTDDISIGIAAIDVFEKHFPEEKLEYEIIEGGKLLRITNRTRWMQQKLQEKETIFSICNGKEEAYVPLRFSELNQGGVSFCVISIEYMLSEANALRTYLLIRELGEHTYTIEITADSSETYITAYEQKVFNNIKKEIPFGLPPLASFTEYGKTAIDFPLRICWINYWSEAMAAKVGFNYEKDKDLFFKVEQLPSKGWMLQLTEEVLDLHNPAHLERLKNAYKRFQKVGGQYLLPEHLRESG